MKLCRGCKQKKALIHFWKQDGEIFTQCSECRSLPRVCSKCKKVKPPFEYSFARRASGNYSYQSWCKSCCAGRYQRTNSLKRKYGMTLEDYDDLLKTQNGACAICQQSEPINSRRLAVDHDHITGEVRGLLCSQCNRGIGYLKDDPDILEAAAQYLRKST